MRGQQERGRARILLGGFTVEDGQRVPQGDALPKASPGLTCVPRGIFIAFRQVLQDLKINLVLRVSLAPTRTESTCIALGVGRSLSRCSMDSCPWASLCSVRVCLPLPTHVSTEATLLPGARALLPHLLTGGGGAAGVLLHPLCPRARGRTETLLFEPTGNFLKPVRHSSPISCCCRSPRSREDRAPHVMA